MPALHCTHVDVTTAHASAAARPFTGSTASGIGARNA